MRIAHVSAEVSPFAKTGGLGDVVGALPKAQAELGHDVSVYMPLYRQVWETLARLGVQPETVASPMLVRVGQSFEEVGFLRTWLPNSNVPVYLIGSNRYFDRPELYSADIHGHDDGAERYTVFVRAALALMKAMWQTPDVLHAHDWHAAAAPMFLAWDDPHDWVFDRTTTVLTIHNLAYQGVYGAEHFGSLRLPSSALRNVEWKGAINLLKGGILAADAVTAVSPTFAYEITTREGGFGLDAILRERQRDLTGIVNGIDPHVWNPAIDPKIPARYDADSLEKKEANRRALLELGHMDPDNPELVVGIVGRLTHQKGYDLLFPVMQDLLNEGVRFMFLGSGESELESAMRWFSTHAPGRFWGYVGFQEELAHLIEAGSDTFLMPSRFEPCGLNQMYSLAYGTPPIVRRVGGLADTVIGYDGTNRDTATGFSFEAATSEALKATVGWARVCHKDSDLWQQIVSNGMKQDFSWRHSARLYDALYARYQKR